jgi:hypothetical protein
VAREGRDGYQGPASWIIWFHGHIIEAKVAPLAPDISWHARTVSAGTKTIADFVRAVDAARRAVRSWHVALWWKFQGGTQ